VHDSYWTHAASVDQMNVALREQFIRLHQEPLLETFRSSLYDRFPEIEFPPIPPRGDFDLEKIKESVYFFS
jgi:DNA-directed RNA polymerase, mitochondrial